MYRKPRRGDVYFANMNGATGSEQSGIRPVVIVQNDKGNHFSNTTIVAMITSKKKRSTAVHDDVHCRSAVHTYWMQRGRRFLYEFLKERGYLPLCERGGDADENSGV